MTSKIIALEEHYADAELTATFDGADATQGACHSRAARRCRGAAPQGDGSRPALRSRFCRTIRRRRKISKPRALCRWRAASTIGCMLSCVRIPTRFAAFAALPTDDPAAAADELERTVTKLQFKGAMLHGRSRGEWLDHPRFLPIFERAAALDVPLYLHPSNPHPDVVRAYYEDYAQEHPMLVRAAWGYTVETATQAIRLVLSNVFEKYPNLKIVLGHLGETLPFLLERIDESLVAQSEVRPLVPPGVLPPLLRDDQRQFFHPGPAVLDHGTGRRPRLVLGRLALCRERQGRRVDGQGAVEPGGQGQDLVRQREAAVALVSAADRTNLRSWNAAPLKASSSEHEWQKNSAARSRW